MNKPTRVYWLNGRLQTEDGNVVSATVVGGLMSKRALLTERKLLNEKIKETATEILASVPSANAYIALEEEVRSTNNGSIPILVIVLPIHI